MLGVLVEFNSAWANKAPVLILAFAHTQFEKDGRPNRHAFYDLGQAVCNLFRCTGSSTGLANALHGGI